MKEDFKIINKFSTFLLEKEDFVVYHNTYSATIDAVEKYANDKGYGSKLCAFGTLSS